MERPPRQTLPVKLLWFGALWTASVVTLSAVAFAIRLALRT
jgi:hypothetical protein